MQRNNTQNSTFTAGGDYWKGENHAGVSTYWLRDESIAVVQHAGAWTYDAIYLAEKAGGKFRITEIGDVIESCFRRYLDRVQHRAYQSVRGADGMNVAIEAGKSHLTRNSLTMNVRAYVPKTWDDPKAFRYYGTMRLALTHSRNGLHAHVVSLKKRLRRPDED